MMRCTENPGYSRALRNCIYHGLESPSIKVARPDQYTTSLTIAQLKLVGTKSVREGQKVKTPLIHFGCLPVGPTIRRKSSPWLQLKTRSVRPRKSINSALSFNRMLNHGEETSTKCGLSALSKAKGSGFLPYHAFS